MAHSSSAAQGSGVLFAFARMDELRNGVGLESNVERRKGLRSVEMVEMEIKKRSRDRIGPPRTKTRIAIAIGSKMVPVAIGYSWKQNFLVQVERTYSGYTRRAGCLTGRWSIWGLVDRRFQLGSTKQSDKVGIGERRRA